MKFIPQQPEDIVIGKRYSTKYYGTFKIVKYNSCTDVEVVFDTTGYRHKTNNKDIRAGQVRDPFYPRIKGKGYLGIGQYTASGYETLYRKWHMLLSKCYCPNNRYYHLHGAKGHTVAPEFHDFQFFCQWYIDMTIEMGLCWYKDKLTVRPNEHFNGQFNIHTMRLSRFKHSLPNTAKEFTFIDPFGYEVTFTNITRFCQENDLTLGSMYAVMRGMQKQHKGWTYEHKG